ncbi:MAG: methionine biosynthesis protein [Actinobacteria bacterium]|nr:MAG: methionine biosynthesis protein [Actinomycetota bacterium]
MTAAELRRRDLARIADLVPRGSRVLDLGCGDGTLLALLRDTREADVHGVELDLANVAECVRRDIPVVQFDIDEGLPDFADGSFDIVVLSQTLQVVRRPALVLREMLRVGKRGIVSFPNFGHWKARAYLTFRGRMPMSRSIPYSWYDTPNIHLTTLKDFRAFVAANGGHIEQELPLATSRGGHQHEVALWPNLFADTGVAVVCAGAPAPRTAVRGTSQATCCGYDVDRARRTYEHGSHR